MSCAWCSLSSFPTIITSPVTLEPHLTAALPQDVARALIDTLGGLTRPSPCCRAPSARAIGGEEIDGVLEAFRLAVTELCGMCGREVTEAGDWTQLGLPLR